MAVRDNFTDGLVRCAWVDDSAIYQQYHDVEWGRPVADDRSLFEQLSLEGVQSGLSWRIILNKREGFRRGFCGFDIDQVAQFGAAEVHALAADAGIVRHRGKIEAVINNAKRAQELRAEFSTLGAYFWARAVTPGADSATALEKSAALSKDLKKRGWKFVGPTTVHAFMQATGMVNDHAPACHRHAACEDLRARFVRPV